MTSAYGKWDAGMTVWGSPLRVEDLTGLSFYSAAQTIILYG